MIVKLLTEHHLEFLNLNAGCTDSSESTLVKCHIVGNHMYWLNFKRRYQLVTSALSYVLDLIEIEILSLFLSFLIEIVC